ncbi:MAG: LCP family protein [Synechococcaceae cyanobacterium]|nr:LCP family protein [Synechococcaceae cyanobacterium]
MAPRRDSRPSARRPDRGTARQPQAKRRGWLRRPPLPSRRGLALAGSAAVGLIGAGWLLGLVWPLKDRSAPPRQEITAATLAEKPRRPITVLVVGIDADRIGDPVNGAAPRGPANSDALLLVRVNPKGPLQVLNLPPELAVNLPGRKQPVALGTLYRAGGVALVAEAVRELVGLEPPKPDRYLVLSRGGLRDLVNGLGGLELSPPRKMKYEDKSLNYRIDLLPGLQRMGGAQVEQMVRFRDRWLGEAGRRSNHQVVQTALRERLGKPEQLAALPSLLASLQDKVDTNLGSRETLSLLAAALDDRRPVEFSSLPLDPAKPGHGKLRQLPKDLVRPFWKEPPNITAADPAAPAGDNPAEAGATSPP